MPSKLALKKVWLSQQILLKEGQNLITITVPSCGGANEGGEVGAAQQSVLRGAHPAPEGIH